MLISEALEIFERAKKGAVTKFTHLWYRQRIEDLKSFLGDVAIEDVTAEDLDRWKESLMEKTSRWANHPGRPEVEGGLSNWTIRGYLRTIRIFFNFFVEQGHLEDSPAKRLKLPRRPKNQPKFIKQEDALAMLKVAQDNPRDYAILLFLADTGCRLGSIVSLRIDKLDLNGHVGPNGATVYFAPVEAKGFGGIPRETIVYFGEKTAEAFRAYLEVRPQNGCEQVFVGLRGALQESGVYQVLKRLAAKAGVEENWNPHAFRHAWAYGARINGADIATVSESLGHSGIAVTHEFYGQLPNLQIGERHIHFSWINSVEEDAAEEDSTEDESAESDSAEE